jgi:hypothetical protein
MFTLLNGGPGCDSRCALFLEGAALHRLKFI